MKARWATWLKPIVGLGLVLGLLLLVDVDAVVHRLRDAQPLWLAAAALALIAATLVGASGLYLLLDDPHRPTLLRFIPLFWVSWAVGLLLPGQVGDMATIAAGLRQRGYAWHTAVGRNLVDKGVSLAVIISCASFGLFLWVDLGRALPVLGCLLALGLLLVLAVRRLAGLSPSPSYAPVRRLLGFVGQVLREVGDAARRYPHRVLANLVLTLVKFGLTAWAYGAAIRSMGGGTLATVDLVTTVAASSLVAYVPLSPNGIGTAEAAGMALFGHLGVPESAVLAAYLALRVLVLSLAWLPVGIWLLIGASKRT